MLAPSRSVWSPIRTWFRDLEVIQVGRGIGRTYVSHWLSSSVRRVARFPLERSYPAREPHLPGPVRSISDFSIYICRITSLLSCWWKQIFAFTYATLPWGVYRPEPFQDDLKTPLPGEISNLWVSQGDARLHEADNDRSITLRSSKTSLWKSVV